MTPRTKIICTIGPASQDITTLQEMIRSGLVIARLNFSHGTQEEHRQRIETIRLAAKGAESTVAILLDTKGPEIRLGTLKGDRVRLEEGREVILTTKNVIGDAHCLPVSYQGLTADVQPGTVILIDDGLIVLKVLDVAETQIHCQVINGGELSSHKGVNVPGIRVRLPSVTEKDEQDILFGIQHQVDFIAASFVRTAADVLAIRKLIEEQGADIQIIAKIENQSGVDNLDDIIKVADGIMVARGDLGVDLPAEEVPLVQKKIIAQCNLVGKPVITATQMLDSMIRNPRPTRAEASDVANAILDGTDAIMLSGETAIGKYPVDAVKTMARIAKRTERALNYSGILKDKQVEAHQTVTDAISHATCTIALDLQAEAIITPTASGSTARMVSKYRPQAPIIAASPSAEVLRKLCLVWGVHPLRVQQTTGTDEMISTAVAGALDAGLIRSGDLVVITAGVPVGVPGTTNLLKVHVVGEVLARGIGIGYGVAVGPVRAARNAAEAVDRVQKGDVLVVPSTDREFIPAMEKSAAIITEAGGLTSHAAVVGLNLGVPVVVGVEGAVASLQEGATVTVDVRRGLIYRGIAKVL